MNKTLKQSISIFIVMMLLLIPCSNIKIYAEETNTTVASDKAEVTNQDTDTPSEEDGLTKVAESNQAILYLNESNYALCLVSKETGKYVYTKQLNSDSGGAAGDIQKSDLVLSYFEYAKNKTTLSVKSIDNYSLSVALENVKHELIENGVKITYTIGDNQLTIDDIPKYISKDKMENLVLPNLDEKQKKFLEQEYRIADDSYVRNKDDNLGLLALKRIYSFIFEVGKYTKDDFEADCVKYGVEKQKPKLQFTASVVYQLDHKDLVVTVPLNEIKQSGDQYLHSLELLPYFLSSTSQSDGYVFVPDGSGSIIDLKRKANSVLGYSGRIYGEDILMNAEKYKENKYSLTLPVYGIKFDDLAVLGIIEKGAALCELNVDCEGKIDEFTKVFPKFYIRDLEYVSIIGSEGETIPKYAKDVYNGDICVRYKLLENDKANYVGMAKEYSNYLSQNHQIKESKSPDVAPLYLELLGAVETKKSFLGIPYSASMPLTTAKQAEEMIKYFNQNNIQDMNVIYSGCFNGGMNSSSLNKVTIEQVINRSNFKALYTKGNKNTKIYPGFSFVTAYSSKNLNKSNHLSRFLNGTYAQVYNFNPATMSVIKSNKEQFIISPNYLTSYVRTFLNKASNMKINQISVSDLGSMITTDYNNSKNFGRISAQQKAEEALDILSNNTESLMLKNPNAYSFKYCDSVYDIPTQDNGFKVSKYSVPFIQMVLENKVSYAGISINQLSHLDMKTKLLTCIETKSAPKFTFTWLKPHDFKETAANSYFDTEFHKWKEDAISFYNEYNEFYKKVNKSEMISHEVFDNKLIKVTYSNGVKVYINKTNKELTADGVLIKPFDYIINSKEMKV